MTFSITINVESWVLVALVYFIARLVYRVRKAEKRLGALESPVYRNPKWVWGWL